MQFAGRLAEPKSSSLDHSSVWHALAWGAFSGSVHIAPDTYLWTLGDGGRRRAGGWKSLAHVCDPMLLVGMKACLSEIQTGYHSLFIRASLFILGFPSYNSLS